LDARNKTTEAASMIDLPPSSQNSSSQFTSDSHAVLLLKHRGLQGLRLLAESRRYAEELKQDVWMFAVEIHELRAVHLTVSDLRWLILNSFAEHAVEKPIRASKSRTFSRVSDLTFSERSCFVLTDLGFSFSDVVLASCPHAERRPCPYEHLSLEKASPIPYWDNRRRELRVGDVVVKQFSCAAANQERILASFEEEGWPGHIYDPLPQDGASSPERRLRDTVKSLNRNQLQPLVQFRCDGTGAGICWSLNVTGD
jgi:hypothetical protein